LAIALGKVNPLKTVQKVPRQLDDCGATSCCDKPFTRIFALYKCVERMLEISLAGNGLNGLKPFAINSEWLQTVNKIELGICNQ
jgi:hypothetical protein